MLETRSPELALRTLPNPLLSVPAPALRLSIDRDALIANWRMLDNLSGRARAGAAVKADAYGVGAQIVAPVLHDAGCRDFFVAHWSEVPDLLGLIEPRSVSVLHGPMNEADARFARAAGVKPVINTVQQARLWLQSGGGACDVMVDTGINRLGLAMSELGDEAVAALDIDMLMSHLASADEDVPLNDVQQRLWTEARGKLKHIRASLANSAGIVLGERFLGDVTRPGLSLYGGVPRPELAGRISQVIRPLAAIMQVRSIATGEGVGYNSTFVASRPMRIGTIAIGYADGFLRCWSEKAEFRAGGHVFPVLGRISMDMTAIDLTDARHIDEGDWVEAVYSLPVAAAKSGLSQYELLTLLGQRFARG